MALSNVLIDLPTTYPQLLFDIKYATHDNLSGKPIYCEPYCLLHRDAVPAIGKCIELAALCGYRLRVFDAYRPEKAQNRLWQALPDATYVVAPTQGSNHTRGTAIDLTLVDSEGNDLDMGSAFDEMGNIAHPFTPGVNENAQRNRLILHAIMTAAGFVGIESEWWHFELPQSLGYPLIPAGFDCY